VPPSSLRRDSRSRPDAKRADGPADAAAIPSDPARAYDVNSAGCCPAAERAWEQYWAAIRPIELTAAVERHAGELARSHALRGADALNLASALAIADPDLTVRYGTGGCTPAPRPPGCRSPRPPTHPLSGPYPFIAGTGPWLARQSARRPAWPAASASVRCRSADECNLPAHARAPGSSSAQVLAGDGYKRAKARVGVPTAPGERST
jgi:hypothetical protein